MSFSKGLYSFLFLFAISLGASLPAASDCFIRRICPDGGVVFCRASGNQSKCGVTGLSDYAYCLATEESQPGNTFICCTQSGETYETNKAGDDQCFNAGDAVDMRRNR